MTGLKNRTEKNSKDKLLSDLFDGFSRSKAEVQLAMYSYHGLLTEEKIAPFSREIRERIASLVDF